MRNLLDLKKVDAQVGLGLIYVRKAVLENSGNTSLTGQH